MDKQSLKTQQEKEEKELGFTRLETHRKNLILNASAQPPFDSQASTPTEFYSQLLSKKSQFKAKETLSHRLLIEKVSFNPGAAFITCLWHAEFFWLLPDSPSGVSLFFCPEAKSMNMSDLEKERSFALVDKLKATDLENPSKQKLYLPTSVMDMVFMVQNFPTIISLCFGKNSHSASFQLGWCNHMFENRLMYSSLHATDNQFFAKVLFAIDSTLQIHWRSCCTSSDRESVNDKVLLMHETQDLILRHNFIQQLPKSITERFIVPEDNKDKFKFGKNGLKNNPNNDNYGAKDIITN